MRRPRRWKGGGLVLTENARKGGGLSERRCAGWRWRKVCGEGDGITSSGKDNFKNIK